MNRILKLALLCAVIVQAAWAQQRQKVTIIFPTRASQTWPLYIAKEGGYYEKYGFDVDLVFGVHPTAIAAIVSDQALMSPYTLEQSMQAAFRDGIRADYERAGSPYFATARLWDDGIIDPRDTRRVLAFTLSIARESVVRPLNPITFGVARM